MRCVVPIVAFALALAPQAGAAIYWGNSGTIGAAELDGSLRQDAFPTGNVISLRANPCGLAVGGGSLFWAEQSAGTIGRLPLGGGAPDGAFVSGLTYPCGLAADGSYLYWTTGWGGTIGRANIDGTGVQQAFIVGTVNACGVAVDANYVYWANSSGDTIGRARLDGSEVDQSFVEAPGRPCGVAVDEGYVYWASPELSSIGRAPLAGGFSEAEFIAGAGETCGVAVDDSHVYWTHEWLNSESVGRAALDGSAANDRFIAGAGGRCSVAIDSRRFHVPGPSRPVQFGRPRYDKRSSAVTLPVWVSAPGELTLAGNKVRWSLIHDANPTAPGGHRWHLRLRPGRGKAAAQLRKQLRKRGRAATNIHVTFVEADMLPSDSVASVNFKRPLITKKNK